VFDVDGFIAECLAANTEASPQLAIKEILQRAVASPDDLASSLNAKPGVAVMYRDANLTIASVVVPAGAPRSLPHDHRIWALVGIYGGQEDNHFFRRATSGLEESGGRSLKVSDTLAMGTEAIHAIENPLSGSSLAAIHVYGGDLIATERSMWTLPEYDEQPYDDTKVLGAPIRS